MKNTKSMDAHTLVCKCDNDIFPLNMRTILNFIGDFSADGWWDWHIQEKFEYMSPKFWSVLGYDYETKTSSPSEWQSIIFPEDLKLVTENINRHVDTLGEYPFYITVRYKHKDGHTVHILCRGKVIEWDGKKPVRMIGTHTDVTKEKELLENIRKESDFFKIVFYDGLTACTIKNKNGIYEDVNRKFCEITGYSREELIGKNSDLITIKSFIKADRIEIENLYKKRADFISVEKNIICKDGRQIICSVMQVLVNYNGEDKVYSQIIDVSNNKAIIDKINAIRKTIKEQR